MGTYKARDLMKTMSEAAWVCGDPGVQYDTTINDWHTCANTDRINASNPCSEYMFLDDTACNLASLNLMKFYDADAGFDVASFRHVCEVVISGHGDHRRQRQLPDRRGSGRTRTSSAPWASATPTSAPCSWPAACPTTPTPAATTRRRSPP